MDLKQTLGVGLVSAFIAALGSTAFASPGTHVTGPNLVRNPGFEATATIAGSFWTPSGFLFEGFDYFIDSNPADAQSGNRSFAGGGIGAPGFISQSIPTLPGQNYTIDLWLANLSGFSGDTEWTENLIPIARNADLFIAECYAYDAPVRYHSSWAVLRQQMSRLAAKRLMITHMGPDMLAHLDAITDPRVILAEDGLVIDI